MIKIANEYEPDLLNTFRTTRLKTQKFTKNELISTFETQKFCSFWKTISP